MSIERCYVCERNVDTDYEEVLYWNDAPWCQRCWGPEQKAKYDFKAGKLFSANPFDKDGDGFSDYMRYESAMNDYVSLELKRNNASINNVGAQIQEYFRRVK